VAGADLQSRLDGDPKLAASVLDIFEHSFHFADSLLRYPELLDEIGQPLQLEGEPLEEAESVRRFYRRQMLRIPGRKHSRSRPHLHHAGKTSALADKVIAAAYRIALTEAPPPASASYTPADQMMVIALGRLGMREFDLGSDADLVFVIPGRRRGRATRSGPASPNA